MSAHSVHLVYNCAAAAFSAFDIKYKGQRHVSTTETSTAAAGLHGEKQGRKRNENDRKGKIQYLFQND